MGEKQRQSENETEPIYENELRPTLVRALSILEFRKKTSETLVLYFTRRSRVSDPESDQIAFVLLRKLSPLWREASRTVLLVSPTVSFEAFQSSIND